MAGGNPAAGTPAVISLGPGGAHYMHLSYIDDYPNLGRLYVYEREDRNEIVYVRKKGTMTIQVTDKWQTNGRFKVTCQTMGGFTAFDSEYKLNQGCYFKVVMDEARAHLIRAAKVSPNTKLTYVRGTTVINGRFTLKRGKPTESWEKFQRKRQHFFDILWTLPMEAYFKKKNREARMCIV